MAFDRSKFGATSVQAIKKQEETQEKLRPSNRNSGGGDINYIKLEAGDNIVRIYPFHPDKGGEVFAEAKTVSFLSIEVPKKDENGKEIEGQTEVKRKPIFNARVHGVDDAGDPLGIDLVETYLGLLKEDLQERYKDDEKEFKKKWGIATGFKSDDSLKPQDSWVMYASKFDEETNSWGKLGLLEVKSSIRNGLNDLAADLGEGDNEAMSVEPFTDPDNGYAVVIVKNPDAQPADYYKVKPYETTVKKGSRITKEIVPVELSDEDLEQLSEKKSLFEMYRNQYTQSDFEKQWEGLERFDKKHKFGITDSEDFADAVLFLKDAVLPDPVETEDDKEEEIPAEKDQKGKAIVTKAKARIEKQVEDEEVEEVVSSTVEEESDNESEVDMGLAKARLDALKKRIGKK